MRSKSIARLAHLVLTVALLGGSVAFAQDKESKEMLTVTVSLKDRYNSAFTVCMPISEKMPIDISWNSGPINQRLLVDLKPATEETYPLIVTLKVFVEGKVISAMTHGGKYKLDNAVTHGDLVSSAFYDYREQSIMLSKQCYAVKGEPGWKEKIKDNAGILPACLRSGFKRLGLDKNSHAGSACVPSSTPAGSVTICSANELRRADR